MLFHILRSLIIGRHRSFCRLLDIGSEVAEVPPARHLLIAIGILIICIGFALRFVIAILALDKVFVFLILLLEVHWF